MIPPSDICRRLAKLHSHLRLGFDGESGQYGLIQLYHRRDFNKTVREPWGHRGPIYSKKGEWRSDWGDDRFPVYLTGLTPQVVHGGEVLGLVKRWARPIAPRIKEGALERGKDAETKANDLCEDMGAKVFRTGQRDGAGAPIVAKKFIKPTPNQRRMRQGELDFTEKCLPPPPPGGWDVHEKRDFADSNVGETLPGVA